MTEQQDAIETLAAAGVVDALKWAAESACRRTMADYEPAAGYDTRWVGSTRYILLEDRQDRVFSCGLYAPPSDGAEGSLDVVQTGLLPGEIESMPSLPAGRVVRSDVNGSQGWACGEYRWLMMSAKVGHIEEVAWQRMSKTRQRVALQPAPPMEQGTLFEDTGEQSPEVAALLNRVGFQMDRTTLQLAHSLDAVSGRFELFIGRPRYNIDGGLAWHWKEPLITMPVGGGGRLTVPAPTAPEVPAQRSVEVPDAVVRLRPGASVRPSGRVAEGQ